jgi:hypothetical protein
MARTLQQVSISTSSCTRVRGPCHRRIRRMPVDFSPRVLSVVGESLSSARFSSSLATELVAISDEYIQN